MSFLPFLKTEYHPQVNPLANVWSEQAREAILDHDKSCLGERSQVPQPTCFWGPCLGERGKKEEVPITKTGNKFQIMWDNGKPAW